MLSSNMVVGPAKQTSQIIPSPLDNGASRKTSDWQQAEMDRLERNDLRDCVQRLAEGDKMSQLRSRVPETVKDALKGLGRCIDVLDVSPRMVQSMIEKGKHHDPGTAKVLQDFLLAVLGECNPQDIKKVGASAYAQHHPDKFFATVGENMQLDSEQRFLIEEYFGLVGAALKVARNDEAIKIIWRQAPWAPVLTSDDVYEWNPKPRVEPISRRLLRRTGKQWQPSGTTWAGVIATTIVATLATGAALTMWLGIVGLIGCALLVGASLALALLAGASLRFASPQT